MPSGLGSPTCSANVQQFLRGKSASSPRTNVAVRRLGVTHWSSRLLATELGISHSTVARVWAEHDLKPWQVESFKFSTDPELFFAIIERQALRRGDFASVQELVAAVRRFCDGWNRRCQSFGWTEEADQILTKPKR